jgi:hypothetical protein
MDFTQKVVDEALVARAGEYSTIGGKAIDYGEEGRIRPAVETPKRRWFTNLRSRLVLAVHLFIRARGRCQAVKSGAATAYRLNRIPLYADPFRQDQLLQALLVVERSRTHRSEARGGTRSTKARMPCTPSSLTLSARRFHLTF